MKKLNLFIALSFFFIVQIFAQSLKTFEWDGVTRKYRIFVPSSYNGSKAVPLVLALHGMGDNSAGFQNIGLNPIATRDTFIAVYPEALVDSLFGATAWNCGVGALGIYVSDGVDDIGFLSALIDSITDNYNIDHHRIYATGFSLGGFMTQRLACELNDKIAAIASVSGTIGAGITCTPGRPVPVMHMHGTADATITYQGEFNMPGIGLLPVGMSVDDMIAHWRQNNGCTGEPDSTHIANVSGHDIDRFAYNACDDSSEVLLYKIFGLGHAWLGTYATEEVWKFLSRHKKTDTPTGIKEVVDNIITYPNPFSDAITITGLSNQHNVSLYDLTGREMLNVTVDPSQDEIRISTSRLEKGVYVLMLTADDGQMLTRKLIRVN